MRIAYGVASEGMGHATRSQSVIDRLIRHGHTVEIFSSDRAYDFFEQKGYTVHRIKGFHLVYEGNSLANTKSFLGIVRTLPQGLMPAFHTVAHHFQQFRPNVVVSDFEFFTAFAGKVAGIPVIAANNISIVDKTRIRVKVPGLMGARNATLMTAQLATMGADWYVIPSFFFPKVTDKRVLLADAPVRKGILKAKPTQGRHIIVYQTTPTALRLLRMLRNVPEQFYVYGFGERPREGNLTFFAFSDAGFIRHLASAKAVITGGGFSLMTESLYLRKPTMSVPLRDHFEQIMNGYYLRQRDFGDFAIEPTPQDVHRFLSRIDEYEATLRKADFDPEEFGATIEQLAKRIAVDPEEGKLRALCMLVGHKPAKRLLA